MIITAFEAATAVIGSLWFGRQALRFGRIGWFDKVLTVFELPMCALLWVSLYMVNIS